MKTTVVVESLSYCKTNVLFQRISADFKCEVLNEMDCKVHYDISCMVRSLICGVILWICSFALSLWSLYLYIFFVFCNSLTGMAMLA